MSKKAKSINVRLVGDIRAGEKKQPQGKCDFNRVGFSPMRNI